MRDATSSDGVYVVLKVIDDDTDELAILKHLNEIKSAANHTIELHGIVCNSIAKVIALRYRIPLNEYFRFHHPPESAASFPEQFLEGVAFLHEYRIAHLDLKPGNVVVDDLDRERKHPPRLVIIDFGLSIFVEDEHTTIEGFCGTPPWVAPEVGTRDGPDMTYSAILADRWACGRMVDYIEKLLAGCGDGSQGQIQEMLKDRLISADPRARPAVKEVLDAYRVSTKGGVKRVAEAEDSDGTPKRARGKPYVCRYSQYSVASDC
jgi:serine/threonine protein kinase